MVNNFFIENCTVYETMWKNTVEPHRPQMTIWCMCIAWWITKAADTLTIRNNYCFSTATMAMVTRLHVTLYVHCLSCISPASLSLIAQHFNTQMHSTDTVHLPLLLFIHDSFVRYLRSCCDPYMKHLNTTITLN
jgi:hypothetical protein